MLASGASACSSEMTCSTERPRRTRMRTSVSPNAVSGRSEMIANPALRTVSIEAWSATISTSRRTRSRPAVSRSTSNLADEPLPSSSRSRRSSLRSPDSEEPLPEFSDSLDPGPELSVRISRSSRSSRLSRSARTSRRSFSSCDHEGTANSTNAAKTAVLRNAWPGRPMNCTLQKERAGGNNPPAESLSVRGGLRTCRISGASWCNCCRGCVALRPC